jgi:hypothetical protein
MPSMRLGRQLDKLRATLGRNGGRNSGGNGGRNGASQ